jgi:hypothetical protein
VGGIEIFKGGDLQPLLTDIAVQAKKFLRTPEFAGIARSPPTRVTADWIVAREIITRGPEIIDQMDHHMGAACLEGKAIMFAVELVTVKAESKLHHDWFSLESCTGARKR